MELIDGLESALMQGAQMVAYFLSLPCPWLKNVSVGTALLALIVLAMLFWLFIDLFRK